VVYRINTSYSDVLVLLTRLCGRANHEARFLEFGWILGDSGDDLETIQGQIGQIIWRLSSAVDTSSFGDHGFDTAVEYSRISVSDLCNRKATAAS
jgi:hypothetical protein